MIKGVSSVKKKKHKNEDSVSAKQNTVINVCITACILLLQNGKRKFYNHNH